MMQPIRAVLASLLLTASLSPALALGNATLRVVPYPGVNLSCRMGSAFADGCPSAATDGTFQVSTAFQPGDYFNTASASAVNYTATNCTQQGVTVNCRAPWNVAGVDYPIGVQASAVLQDPATAGIPGCSFTTAAWGGNVYTCGGSLFGAATAPTAQLSNIELGPTGGHGCTALMINTPATGVTGLIMKNIHFFNDTALCSGDPVAHNVTAITNNSGAYTAGILLTQCDLDGNGHVFSSGFDPNNSQATATNPAAAIKTGGPSGTVASPFTITYCHIHNFLGNPIFPVWSATSFLTVKYSFIEDWCIRSPSCHSEWVDGGQGNLGIRGEVAQYNVILQHWNNSQVGPAPFWYSSNWFNPQPIDLIDYSNNTQINQWAGGLQVAGGTISGCMGGVPTGVGTCDTTHPDGTFYLTAGFGGQGLNPVCGGQDITLFEEIPGSYPIHNPPAPDILDEFKMDNTAPTGVASSYWPAFTVPGVFCNAAKNNPNQAGDAGVIDGHGGMLIGQVNIHDNWFDVSSQAAPGTGNSKNLYLFIFDVTTAITNGSVSGSTLTFTAPASSLVLNAGEAVVGTGIGSCGSGTQFCPRILTTGTYAPGTNIALDSSIPTPVSNIAINVEKIVQCSNPASLSGNVDSSGVSYTDTFMNTLSPASPSIPAIGC